jgi:hypothetical protein
MTNADVEFRELREHFWKLYDLWKRGDLTFDGFKNELALEGQLLAEASDSFDERASAAFVICSRTKAVTKNRFDSTLPPQLRSA